MNNLLKESLQISFILNFQVTLLGFRRTLRSIPLFYKSIGETEEVLSKVEEEQCNTGEEMLPRTGARKEGAWW